MKKRILCALLAGALCLSGCSWTREPVKGTTFAMDTAMNLTLYGGWNREKTKQTRDRMLERLAWFDGLFSAANGNSDISRLNRAEGQPVEVNGLTVQLLDKALALCEVTGGALDITAYPAVKAWGFTTGEHHIPSPDELAELAANIDYRKVPAVWAFQVEKDIEVLLESQSEPVHIDGGSAIVDETVTLPAGVEIDLGAVAKGYAGDRLAAAARESDISSALLDLGQSTIVAVGTKPDGSPWRIGIVDPAQPGSYFAVVELEDCAMGTSGGYQRFFEQDGVTYWHILDPATAAPARSGLASVTVLSPSALTCDGLSTALFVMGLERGTAFWQEHPELEFEAIFVTEDGGIYRTAGLEGRFSLAEGYENREVTVLE